MKNWLSTGFEWSLFQFLEPLDGNDVFKKVFQFLNQFKKE